MLVVLNMLLPEILREFSKFEGHIASSALEAALFVKLAAFMIIQTFFVTAISGSIWGELSNILKSPGEIMTLLGNSLPSQSTFFLQLICVSTFVSRSPRRN
jgi:p-aminobenzoyl-glutamate transporter AbgT